uniref:Epstein-Barr virus EBNA-1-like protein n=1 Tax=Oryza sativa subsp. japonica TaxID=39947 RepID=Q60ES6_ORYSJ|nr:hypothetical protein [Oryza sativa Japonica Group]
MSVWERGTDFGRSSQRAGALASSQIGDREEGNDAGRGRKRKKEGRKGACPLPLWEKEEGMGATRQREEELCLRPLEASARSGGGRVDDDGDDGGARSDNTGGRRGQARQALAAAATGRSATTVRTRAGGAAIWAASAGTAARAEREEGSARLTGRAGREREREPGREGEMGREGFGPSNPREAK